MLMSKPTALELVSTSVDYKVPLFDDSLDYDDGTEVRIDDDIFVTKKKNTSYPLWDDVTYDIGDRVVSPQGRVYERIDQLFHPNPPCGFGLPPGSTDCQNIVEWDGVSPTAILDCSPSKKWNYIFTQDLASSTIGERVFDVVVTDLNDGEAILDSYTIHVVTSISLAVSGKSAIYRGWLMTVTLGVPTFDESLDNRFLWKVLPDGFGVSYIIDLQKIRSSVKLQPLDSKQYTSAVESGPQTWVLKSLQKFDTIAIGRLKGSAVTVVFKDSTGAEVTRHDEILIDGRIDADGRLPHTYTTMILYADTDIEANGTIEITVSGVSTEVGMIKSGLSIDLGFTNIEFKNNGKDYSPKQQSPISGYIDYIEGVKVMVHKGSIDIPMERYDITSRFIRDFLGSLMIINGSDSKNIATDSMGIFSATQLIARITRMDMGTKVKDGDIDPIVPIPFECEEIV